MRQIIKRLQEWLRPQSIYILVATDGDDVREIIPVSSFTKAQAVRSALIKTYGGSGVTLASRLIDDVPYLVRRRLLVDSMTKQENQ
jgi:hypothetical protein